MAYPSYSDPKGNIAEDGSFQDNFFFPKDPAMALFLVKHELYHRLTRLELGHKGLAEEQAYLKSLLDAIERS
jgi:hypothetical protein